MWQGPCGMCIYVCCVLIADGPLCVLLLHQVPYFYYKTKCHCLVAITTIQFNLTKPEFSFCACLNPAGSVPEACDGENHQQWLRLKISVNLFYQSIILPNEFIISIFYVVYLEWLLGFIPDDFIFFGYYMPLSDFTILR